MARSTRVARGFVHKARPQKGWRLVGAPGELITTNAAVSGAAGHVHSLSRPSSGANRLVVKFESCEIIQLKAFGQGAADSEAAIAVFGVDEIGGEQVDFLGDRLFEATLTLGTGPVLNSRDTPFDDGFWVDTAVASNDETPDPGVEVRHSAVNAAVILEWTHTGHSWLVIEADLDDMTALGFAIKEV